MKRIVTLSITFLCLTQLLLAQSDSTTANKVQFKLSVNYNSGLNYYGRTDSLKSRGFYPLAELWLSPEWYINAAPVFVNNRQTAMDYTGTITALGYQHLTTHWLTSAYVSKPFYKAGTELVQSALKAQGALNLSWLNKIINISAGADMKYSDKADYGASAGLDHIVKIPLPQNSVFVLDPSVMAYAGTQNFTNTWYRQKPGFLFLPGTSQQVSRNSQQFNILSYEASLPLILAHNHWQLLITPAYVIPQNLITIPGHPEESERGTNLFYVTTAVKYIF